MPQQSGNRLDTITTICKGTSASTGRVSSQDHSAASAHFVDAAFSIPGARKPEIGSGVHTACAYGLVSRPPSPAAAFDRWQILNRIGVVRKKPEEVGNASWNKRTYSTA
jgi:hypothetical protein